MSTVFLFGAGASFGSVDVTPYPPPLGACLFDELQKQGGVASKIIDEELAAKFRQNFEYGMAEFCQKHNAEVIEFLKETARYLANFDIGYNNLYISLLKILKGTRKRAVFATTNYDLLIELAISRYGLFVTYGGLPVQQNNIPVLKIHGSCNFLPDLPYGAFRGGKIVGIAGRQEMSMFETPIKAVSTDEAIKYCSENNTIPPALAIFAKGKQVLTAKSFITEQQNAFSAEVRQAKRIFVIGLRVNAEDEHIWSVLANSKAYLGWAGGEKEEFEKWCETNKRKGAHFIGDTFEDALTTIDKKINSR